MTTHPVRSTRGRRSFLLVLAIVLGALGVWDAGAADKAQWTRVLINRGRGDLEAAAALLRGQGIVFRAVGDVQLSEKGTRLVSEHVQLAGRVARSSMPDEYGDIVG